MTGSLNARMKKAFIHLKQLPSILKGDQEDSTKDSLSNIEYAKQILEEVNDKQLKYPHIRIKEHQYRSYEWNRMLEELARNDVVMGFRNGICVIFKNELGTTGELGSDELLHTLLTLLRCSFDCDVDLFRELFVKELHDFIADLIKKYNLDFNLPTERHRWKSDGQWL